MIERITILFLIFLSTAGCGSRVKPGGNEGDESSDPWRILVQRTAIEAALSDSELPTSPNAFLDEFKRRYEHDPEEAFVELTDWGNSAQKLRMHVLKEMLFFASDPDSRQLKAELLWSEMDILPVREYDSDNYVPDHSSVRQLHPEPTHVLKLVARYDVNSSGTFYYAVAERDGRYCFCSRSH